MRGLTCADFGCSTGGFTDCLLQAGAAHVHAIDTAYGQLAWKLRTDPRVTVVERTNALHATPPDVGIDLVVADMGWTPQRLIIPAALRWLRATEPHATDLGSARSVPPTSGAVRAPAASFAPRIISLIKPHYELSDRQSRDSSATPRRRETILEESAAEQIASETAASLPPLGVTVLGLTKSPILGGGSRGHGSGGRGNPEWLILLAPAAVSPSREVFPSPREEDNARSALVRRGFPRRSRP